MKQTAKVILAVLLLASIICGCAPQDVAHQETDQEQDSTRTTEETTQETTEESTAPETTEETTEETEPEQIKTTPGYTITTVNVRTGPSVESEVYTVLEAHTDVEILEEWESWIPGLEETSDGWYRIALDGGEYYISASYVRLKQEANGYIIAIDPGHQSQGNYNTEPDGPGSSTMKAKVSSGTQGRTTGLAEYELNLQVALKLQIELENRGYTVIMIRTTNDVDISNSQRAAVANEADADAFVRIHANGSENKSVNGAMTICQTPNNPYNGSLYAESRALSDCILEEFVAATGCKKQYVWETNTMSGINWCQVPVTILEMGYMTNPDEDRLMASEEYQYKMVQGIANGIDRFIAQQNEKTAE